MSPRTYWPAPEGTRVVVTGYAFADGNVLTDPSLPVESMDSQIHTAILSYMQTFGLLGRTANILVEVPYSWARSKGFLLGEPVQRTYSGVNDLGVALGVNLIGAPSMGPKEFVDLRANPRPIVGASLKVVAPTGDYDWGRLLNLGTNRWAFRPRVGCILPLTSRWHLELEAGAWIFTDDNDFVAGERKQNPIVSGEVHIVRRFKPGFWMSLESTYFKGGRQTIGGDRLVDEQDNLRAGVTVALPVAKNQVIKIGFSTSVVTDFGNDFDEGLITYGIAF
ncbi:MAG: transporter [Opitutaceae bacterium]